jgi:hypothetical protein
LGQSVRWLSGVEAKRTRGDTFTPLYENLAVSCIINKRES